MAHPVALPVPTFLILPAYPGAQIVHAETESLPVDELLVQIPKGHDVQEDEPTEDEQVPTGQGKQEDKPRKEYVPGEHVVEQFTPDVPAGHATPPVPAALHFQPEGSPTHEIGGMTSPRNSSPGVVIV